MLIFYGKATGWICGSAIIAVFIGKYLDKIAGKNFYTLICIILGFILSIYGIYREINIYKRNLEKQEKLKQEKIQNVNK